MTINKFKRDFARLNGAYITDNVILLRQPLELYSLVESATLATFGSLDEALNYQLDGKQLKQYVDGWDEITFPPEFGGRGGGSGMGFSGKWPSAGSDAGKDNTTYDHPARMNDKIGVVTLMFILTVSTWVKVTALAFFFSARLVRLSANRELYKGMPVFCKLPARKKYRGCITLPRHFYG